MTDVVYKVVEHDGGWAYKLGDVFSETFPSRRAAEDAAKRVAHEQQTPGDDEAISWEDEKGVWHNEAARGSDRPHAIVADAEPTERSPQPSSAHGRSSSWPSGDHAFAAHDRGHRYAREDARAARDQIRADPLMAALLATVFGLILGLVLRKRR